MQGGRRNSLAISRAKVLHNNVVFFVKKLRKRSHADQRGAERDQR